VIANVRVTVGNGTVIDQGTIAIKAGRIASVTRGPAPSAPPGAAPVIGYKAVNARTSWDAGVVYGYGTDTNYAPKAGLEHELQSLNLMFSMRDIVRLMGPNTASYIEMSDQLGTIEAGKLADIVILPGNPLEGYWNMLNPKLVIKGGVVVSDQR